jgi:NTE family protein
VAFEIARRHRFLGDLESLPASTAVHVMPTGQPEPLRYNDLSQLSYRETAAAAQRIERAYHASLAYLDGLSR